MFVVFIIGTRAEYIKVAPFMRELQNQGLEYGFIHTGQHNLDEHIKSFGTKFPDAVLSKSGKGTTKFKGNMVKAITSSFDMLFKIKNALSKFKKIDFVVYHGDTLSTLLASLVCSTWLSPFKKYRTVHLEAGLRSNNLFEPFPEEIIRIISDSVSDIHLCPSEKAAKNLKGYKKVIVTGNTVVDSVALFSSPVVGITSEKYSVCTVHRHENVMNKKRMSAIVDILLQSKIPIYFVEYDTTIQQLKKFGLYDKLFNSGAIVLIPNSNYDAFQSLLRDAALVFGDGGGLQEECLVLGIPMIVLRASTERQEAIEYGEQYLSKFDVAKTVSAANELLDYSTQRNSFDIKNNPYGSKGVSRYAISTLASLSKKKVTR